MGNEQIKHIVILWGGGSSDAFGVLEVEKNFKDAGKVVGIHTTLIGNGDIDLSLSQIAQELQKIKEPALLYIAADGKNIGFITDAHTLGGIYNDRKPVKDSPDTYSDEKYIETKDLIAVIPSNYKVRWLDSCMSGAVVHEKTGNLSKGTLLGVSATSSDFGWPYEAEHSAILAGMINSGKVRVDGDDIILAYLAGATHPGRINSVSVSPSPFAPHNDYVEKSPTQFVIDGKKAIDLSRELKDLKGYPASSWELKAMALRLKAEFDYKGIPHNRHMAKLLHIWEKIHDGSLKDTDHNYGIALAMAYIHKEHETLSADLRQKISSQKSHIINPVSLRNAEQMLAPLWEHGNVSPQDRAAIINRVANKIRAGDLHENDPDYPYALGIAYQLMKDQGALHAKQSACFANCDKDTFAYIPEIPMVLGYEAGKLPLTLLPTPKLSNAPKKQQLP